jgi:hypothetical protein
MSPGAHLLLGWLSGAGTLSMRRERILVALSSIAPDLDGLGIIVDKISGHTNYYFQFHHYLGHSIFSAIAIATIASIVANTQKFTVWCLAFIVIHIHIICDIVGSKGPDGYQWPIYYLFPLNADYGITWKYQWELNAWQNSLIVLLLILGSLYFASIKKITVLEVFSNRINDEAFRMFDKYCRKKT